MQFSATLLITQYSDIALSHKVYYVYKKIRGWSFQLDGTSYSLFRTLLPIGINEDIDDDDNDVDDDDDSRICMKEEKKLLIKVIRAYAKSIGITAEINYNDIQKVINFKKFLNKVFLKSSLHELRMFYIEDNSIVLLL